MRPAWLDQRLFPFESHFLQLDGHTLHYVDEGKGPTLLMLHGNPTWAFLWRHLIAGLKDRFRCVALDYPGFGLSTARPGYEPLPRHHAQVVEAFVEKLGLERFSPVVQDWGGPIGLWVAGRQAHRVERLLIGNTWAWPVDQDPHFTRFSAAFGGALGGVAIRRLNAFVNLMVPLGTPRRRVRGETLDCYRRVLDTPQRREATHVFPREIAKGTAFLAEVEAGLAALKGKPALLLWGDKDIAFRAQELGRFQASFPGAAVQPLPGAGHYIQEDAPEEMVGAIRAWWPQ